MKCQLVVHEDGFPVEAARGLVFPSTAADMVHGAPLGEGYVKVQVDYVHATFSSCALQFPPNDEISTLGEAKNTFIKWPTTGIVLVKVNNPFVHQI